MTLPSANITTPIRFMHTKNFLCWLLPSENRLMPSPDWTEVDAAVCQVLETALEEEDLRGRAQILQKDVSEASDLFMLWAVEGFMIAKGSFQSVPLTSRPQM